MTYRALLIMAALVGAGLGTAGAKIATSPSEPARPAGAGASGAAVTTAEVRTQDFAIKRRAIGWVESPAKVVVRPRIDSQILEQHVTDGQTVKAGDLLFVLDDRTQQAQLLKDQAALARDQALHARALRDLGRLRTLQTTGNATAQQLDLAGAEEKSAVANVQADEAAIQATRLQLSYTKIFAAIDGRIGSVEVAPGNLVAANGATGLVTITQVNPLRVAFAVPQRDLGAVQAALASAAPPSVRIFPNGAAEATATGRLNFIDSSIDVASGTVTVKAAVANDALALWPGEYVDVEFDLASLPGAAVVPTVAIQPGQAGSFVYLVRPDQTVELRPITVAATDGATSAVEGLAAGERVVVDGQLRLAAGAKVRDARTAS
jgi:multidrug efflux system membrane fusion protein